MIDLTALHSAGVFIYFVCAPPDCQDRAGCEAPHHGQAVRHESGPALQCQEQGGGQQTGGQAGYFDSTLGSTDSKSGSHQRPGTTCSRMHFHVIRATPQPFAGFQVLFYNAFTQWRALTVNIQVVYIKILPHLLMESVIKYLFLIFFFKSCNCVKPNRDSRCSGSGDVQWMLKKK